MERKEHWENVFANKKQNEVSWYQPTPKESIDFFESQNIAKDAYIIDIGSGDSYFIDYLINKGYTNIYALDISENAIQRLKNRLAEKALNVNFIISNILNFDPKLKFDYWHDRAVFHFLTEHNEVNKYKEICSNSISTGGKAMIATFSKSGPLKCSALPITQYDHIDLQNLFAENFNCIESKSIIHPTPFDTTQNFTYCLFEKK